MGTPQRQPATWSLGTIVGGKYRLEALLGAGGFGAVFRAIELGADRRVAVKLLSRASLQQTDAIARFYREARLAMTLRHPNTVRLLDFGDAGEGTPFIAFELLEGVSLEQRIARGPVPIAEALAIAVELLGSLEEAHASHVIHRDVKPANVFLCSSPPGAVKLLDFGVAQEAPSMQRLTREGTIVGTPAYMAPEQLTGGAAGPQTDLFAVALVLAEMIGGAPVYQGEAMQICLAKLNGQPVQFPASIPLTLLAVLQRATSFDVARRHRSAAELRSALQATGLGAGRSTLTPAPVSGPLGTVVIDKPAGPSQRLDRAMAATAPPSINTPLAARPTPSRGMSGTVPLAGRSSHPPSSVLASTTPPSLANPLAATNADRPRPVRPHLAATVNDPDAAASPASRALSGTLAMDDGPRGSVLIAPAPAPRTATRSRGWVVAIVATLLVSAAAVAYYFGRARLSL